MTDETPQNPPSTAGIGEPSHRPRYRQLNGRERAAAIGIGLILASAAFTAMFLTANEAGIAAAMLLAGVLLITGIQGTQVGRLSKDEAGFMAIEEAERQKVADAITSVASGGDPAAAGEVLEAYQSINPDARRSPSITQARSFMNQAIDYERRLMETLPLLAQADVFIDQHVGNSIHVDGLIAYPDGTKIVVEVKHLSGRSLLTNNAIFQLRGFMQMTNAQGGLIVTDSFVPRHVGDAVGNEIVEVVRWSGEGDNEELQKALSRLREKIGRKSS